MPSLKPDHHLEPLSMVTSDQTATAPGGATDEGMKLGVPPADAGFSVVP
jgi:hypothetical protein